MSRLVVDPSAWDMRETAKTAVRRSGFATFTMPNGWTKTYRTAVDGSVMIPSSWFDFTGYTLRRPDGTHAEFLDVGSNGLLIVRSMGERLAVDAKEVYGSWSWGRVSVNERELLREIHGKRSALYFCGERSTQWLYRMFDDSGSLLYVGISDNATRRWREHERDKPWFDEVCTFAREKFHDRFAVEEAEREAIRLERPRYNVTYNSRIAA